MAGEVRRERLDQAIEMADGGQSPAELELLAMAAYVSAAAGSTASEVGALAERVLHDGHALNLEDHMPALGAASGAVNKTLILRWNGTRWVHVASPDPGSSNDLYGVAASSPSNAWAVGTFSGAIREALAIHCC